MSKKVIKGFSEIKYVLVGLDGNKHSFELIPMKTKVALNVLHTLLLTVLESIAGLLSGIDKSDSEAAKEVMQGLKSLSAEDLWEIAEKLFKNAVVDGDEVTDLEEVGAFTDPTIFYRAVYEGVKGNYPDVFKMLALDDLFQALGQEKTDRPLGDTLEQK